MGNDKKHVSSLEPDQELEVRYETYKKILKKLTIMSDIFMRNVFKKRE